jgi:hypothetical protein
MPHLLLHLHPSHPIMLDPHAILPCVVRLDMRVKAVSVLWIQTLNAYPVWMYL